jgi:hypothetical protein
MITQDFKNVTKYAVSWYNGNQLAIFPNNLLFNQVNGTYEKRPKIYKYLLRLIVVPQKDLKYHNV